MHEAFEGEELHALLPVVEPGYAALNAARLPEVAPALVAARNPQAPRIASAMTCRIRIGLAMPTPSSKGALLAPTSTSDRVRGGDDFPGSWTRA
jgi:hypothetical protein